ncbi:MAG TPA: iron-containing alcohol dehydrogenase [Thermoanaerobaculia bacterium]
MAFTFTYANPDVLHFGSGSVREKLAGELSRLGAKRPFLVTTRSGSALASAVEAAAGGLFAGRYQGITQHAPAATVMEAARAAREARADALVSLGGGSPIDATKAAAFALATGLELRDPDAPARSRSLSAAGALPHIAIPTTLSVAELASSAGYTAEGTLEKVGVAAPELMPAAVLYDAELAVRTPLELWLSTGIRAVDHAVETVLAPGEHPLADAAALEALRRLPRALVAAKADPAKQEPRTEGQVAAWLSYLLPGPAARGLSHTLGKRLGSRHGVPHGVTSCLLLPHVVRKIGPSRADAMARLAQALGPSPADAIADLVAALGLPRHLSAFGIGERDLREAARPLAGKPLAEDDLVSILRAAL